MMMMIRDDPYNADDDDAYDCDDDSDDSSVWLPASSQVIKIAQSLPVKADFRLRCEDDEDR